MLRVSERRACRVIGQPRSTQRRLLLTRDDEAVLTADIVELATRYGRYGYRRITALLRHAGWVVNRKRVERIWRREGLKIPQKQPKRGRLWLADGSCIRPRQWRRHYNAVRPHSALGYRPPAPSVVQWPAAPDSSTVARPATAPLAPSASLN